MKTWWEDRRQGGGSGGGESTAERLSVVGSLTEVREEEQQSLARIEKAGEREILRVPARHMVSSQVTSQHIGLHALMETWVQTVLSCCTRKKIYTLNKKSHFRVIKTLEHRETCVFKGPFQTRSKWLIFYLTWLCFENPERSWKSIYSFFLVENFWIFEPQALCLSLRSWAIAWWHTDAKTKNIWRRLWKSSSSFGCQSEQVCTIILWKYRFHYVNNSK